MVLSSAPGPAHCMTLHPKVQHQAPALHSEECTAQHYTQGSNAVRCAAPQKQCIARHCTARHCTRVYKIEPYAVLHCTLQCTSLCCTWGVCCTTLHPRAHCPVLLHPWSDTLTPCCTPRVKQCHDTHHRPWHWALVQFGRWDSADLVRFTSCS